MKKQHIESSTPELRTWMHRNPQPASLRVERADGDDRIVKIGVARSKWRDAESACGGDAIRIEALDRDGNVLRVWEPEVEEESAPLAKQAKVASEHAMLVEFARLLADSCDRATQRQSEMVQAAFGMMTSLLNTMGARNQALEKAWHHLVMSQQPEGADDPSTPIMQTMLALAMQNQPQAKPKKKAEANGSD